MSDSRLRHITGRGIPMPGLDIDTDRIIPARFLKSITFEGLERGLFIDDRLAQRGTDRLHPFDDPQFSGARVLVVGRNFGCGSSREHAPQALYRWGIRAVVGESFADIFFSNALMIGLPCASLSEPEILELLRAVETAPDTEITVDIEHDRVMTTSHVWHSQLPQHAKEAFVSGHWDGAGLLLEHYEDVEAVSAKLPY